MTNFFQNEHGQGMVEYGLLIGFIALVVYAALFALGPKIRDLFIILVLRSIPLWARNLPEPQNRTRSQK